MLPERMTLGIQGGSASCVVFLCFFCLTFVSKITQRSYHTGRQGITLELLVEQRRTDYRQKALANRKTGVVFEYVLAVGIEENWNIQKEDTYNFLVNSFGCVQLRLRVVRYWRGNQKTKWGQESYHHSWRVTQKENEVRNPIIILGGVTQKESEVRNPIIILGGWPEKKVTSGILSSFLAGYPKRKWGQESYHHSWRDDRKRKWRQESYHHSWRVTQKESEVRNAIIILGG